MLPSLPLSLNSFHMLSLLMAAAALLGCLAGRWSLQPRLRRIGRAAVQSEERLADVRSRLDELRAASVRISGSLEIAAERETFLTQEVDRLRRLLMRAEVERDRLDSAARQPGPLPSPAADIPPGFPVESESDHTMRFLGRGSPMA